MYNLISTTKPTAKKEYDCIWCSEKILKGEQHVKEVGNYQGDFQSNRWHQECHCAAQLYFSENNENEFTPYDNKRGSKEIVHPVELQCNTISKIEDSLKKETSFILNDVEIQKYNKWVDSHKKYSCENTMVNVTFIPTAIGVAVHLECQVCNVKEDITDYKSW